MKNKEPKLCEDCGDECETRRTTCPNCGKKVCGWCYYHVHGTYSMIASKRVNITPCQQPDPEPATQNPA
jgi:predicted amidophosphoribosyltransferase